MDAGNGVREIDACRTARESPLELAATVVTCLVAMVVIFFARVGLNNLIFWLQKRKNPDAEYEQTLPFLSWEVQVFLAMFQGIAESAGEVCSSVSTSLSLSFTYSLSLSLPLYLLLPSLLQAIASGCLVYEITGGVVLLVLMLFLGLTLFIVALAVRHQCIIWEHISLKEGIAQMRHAFKHSRGKSCIHRFRSFSTSSAATINFSSVFASAFSSSSPVIIVIVSISSPPSSTSSKIFPHVTATPPPCLPRFSWHIC